MLLDNAGAIVGGDPIGEALDEFMGRDVETISGPSGL
jgi:hypothetical protein